MIMHKEFGIQTVRTSIILLRGSNDQLFWSCCPLLWWSVLLRQGYWETDIHAPL